MTITQLKYVLAVAEHQNFTKAAQKTFVTQPTLSMQIQKLEDEKYPKVKLKIEELNTQQIIERLEDGNLDAAIAATPLENENIKERPLYYEPFVAYIPQNHRLYNKEIISTADLDLNDMLLLEDGHCFRDGVINLCKTVRNNQESSFSLESGSFETLVKLSNEGLGMTLLPYLHTMEMPDKDKVFFKSFEAPSPAREVSLIYHKSELKMQITEALKTTITGIVKGAIAFQNVQIISPIK